MSRDSAIVSRFMTFLPRWESFNVAHLPVHSKLLVIQPIVFASLLVF